MGFNERIGELMWPAAETGGQEASAGDPRSELQKRLLELVAEEKAVVIGQSQRDLDAAVHRRQEL